MKRLLWIFIFFVSCDFDGEGGDDSIILEEEIFYEKKIIPLKNRETLFSSYSSNYQYLFDDDHNKNYFITQQGSFTQSQFIHFKNFYKKEYKNSVLGTNDDYVYFNNRGDGSCGIRARFFKLILYLQRQSHYAKFLTTIESCAYKYSHSNPEFKTNSNFLDAINLLKKFDNKNVKETIIGFNDIHFNEIVIEKFLRTYWKYSAIDCYNQGSAHSKFQYLHSDPERKSMYQYMIGPNGVCCPKNYGYKVPGEISIENIIAHQSSLSGDLYKIRIPCDVYGYFYDQHVDIIMDKSLLK